MITKAQKRKSAKSVKTLVAFGLCTALLTTMGMGTFASASTYRENMPKDGKYYTDYNTYEEAKEAGEKLTEEVAAEGQTLLKNKLLDNGRPSLPLAGGSRVSVFGVGSDSPAGNGISLHDALKQEGFNVNPSLTSFYASKGTTFGEEETEFDKGLENSFKTYNDVAVVVISRGGGEGADMPTVTDDIANDAKENDINGDGTADWTHEGYVNQADGKKHKHFLQMTDSEYKLYDYVKKQGFKKIVYLINVSEIFEIKNLADDDQVDGILWMGRPGARGALSTAGILSGRINPSGKTVDTWYSDFTQDPTWFNAINNAQVGSAIFYSYPGQDRDKIETGGGGFGGNSNTWFGVDYEEDIYLGYRYYETKCFDLGATDGTAWYNKAVSYPFGYGLSYTTYEYELKGVKLGNTALESGAQIDASLIASGAGKTGGGEATNKTITVTVDVTNTGDVAGKETVQLYVNAPYVNGEVEKSAVKLIGFGKTDVLRPGETQTLEITANVQDMASYDYTDANKNGYKGYELDEGEYNLLIMQNAHSWAGESGKCIEVPFEIVNGTQAQGKNGTPAAYLELDDYSGEKIENLFSQENGIFYSLRDNENSKYQFNEDKTANEVLMSRANTAAEGAESNAFTLPEAPTVKDLTISNNMRKSLTYWDSFTVDTTTTEDEKTVTVANKVSDVVIANNSTATTPVTYKDGLEIADVVDAEDYPWMAETTANATAMATWEQRGDYKYKDGTTVKLSDLTGIDPYSTEKVGGEGRFKDMTGVEAWADLMNSLSWQDLMDLAGKLQKQALPSISMNSMADAEFAYSVAGINFTCTCTLAATWNTELANRKGIVAANALMLQGTNTGWGTSANTHRSPFAGRVFEYTSEDGLLGGYISAAETIGANSRGIATYTKHCALNDQETNRNGLNLFAWVSEQAMREIYYKSFQMVAQEGQSAGIMGAFARAGRVSINVNYNFVTRLFRDEWGCKTISFTTDAYAGMRPCSTLDMLVRAGTDNIATNTMSGTWDEKDGKVTVANGDAATEANQWYTTRKCAMIFLWTHANTAMNKNGVSFDWKDATLTGTQGTAVADTKLSSGATGSKVEYVVTNGALPAGLSLEADGTISGTPSAKAGTYNFTVQCKIDNWVTSNKEYTYTVASGFKIDETETAVGEEFFAEITSSTVTTNVYNRGIVYSIKEGALPAGLTLEADGTISGTPTEAGEYTVTLDVAATRYVQSGWSGYAVTDNYEYDVTITVDAGEQVDEIAELKKDLADLEAALEALETKEGTDLTGINSKIDEIKTKIEALEKANEEGGCGGSIAATVIPVAVGLLLVGAAVVLFRRKKDNK